jgi:hypothetical protein
LSIALTKVFLLAGLARFESPTVKIACGVPD